MDNQQPDYRNSPKNIWRHRWWKSAAKRCSELKISPKMARVIYMPGPEDLDRKVARRYGFRDHNLIGVDRDSSLCRDLRKRGVTMINGDIIEVLAAWNPINLPDVILLDTCNALGVGFTQIMHLFICGNFLNKNLVFGANVICGHDQLVMNWRDVQEPAVMGERFAYNPKRNLTADMRKLVGIKPGEIHRGLVFAVWVGEYFLSKLSTSYSVINEINERHVNKILHVMDIEFDSYTSKNAKNRMDSVIFNWSNFIFDDTGRLIIPKRVTGHSLKASRRISAGLAISTMKKNANSSK